MPSRTSIVVGQSTHNTTTPEKRGLPLLKVLIQNKSSSSKSMQKLSPNLASHQNSPPIFSSCMLPVSPTDKQPVGSLIAIDPVTIPCLSSTLSRKLTATRGKCCRILDPIAFIRYENVRLGLRGGSPMWPVGTGNTGEPWAKGQKQGEDSSSQVICKQGLKGGGPIYSDKSTPSSNVFNLGDDNTEESAIARAKVASLVAADYNDFDDENSQLTPPNSKETPAKLTAAKAEDRIPSLDVEISTELELLAESENIEIIDHMTEDSIVTGSEVMEECIISSTNIDSIDDKEKVEQVVEEDEQHVVMMIEENTLTASFSVEQRDKLTSKTFVRKVKLVEDSEAPLLPGVGGIDANVCSSSSSNDSTMVKSATSTDVRHEEGSLNATAKNRYATVDVQPSKSGKMLTEVQSAMKLVQMRKEISENLASSATKIEVMFGADEFKNNSAFDSLEIVPENTENVNVIQSESTVLDLSTNVQDCIKIEGQGITIEEEKNGHVGVSQQCFLPASEIIPSVPLVVNKTLKGVGQMLLVADSPESPDQQEMNVDPSPEPLYHEFESLFSKMGQDTGNLIVKPTHVPSAKLEEITSSTLPKDSSVSERAKESIFALLKEEKDDLTFPEIEPKKSMECNILQSFNSNVEKLSSNNIHKDNIGVSCSLVRPVVTYPTTNVDTVVAKLPLSKQQNLIVSRGAVSISLLDPTAFPSVPSQCVSKASPGEPYVGINDAVMIQRRRRSDQLIDKEETVSSMSLTTAAVTATPVAYSVPASIGQQSVPVVTNSGNTGWLPSPPTTDAIKAPTLVCNALSTVTISVITSTPKVTPVTHTTAPVTTTSVSHPLASTLAATQPLSLTNKNPLALNLTVKSKPENASTSQSLPATSAGSLPPSSACTLSVIGSGETFVPLTSITSSMQVSQLLNLPARSLQTLIQNNQLFKSCPSTSQGRAIPVSSTQSLTGPILSAQESVVSKSMHTSIVPIPKSNQTREVESQQHFSVQNQSRNSEITLYGGEKTKTGSAFDDSSKFLEGNNLTLQKHNSVNVSKTTSQIHPQIVSVLESRLMSSSEYNYQQTSMTTSTSIANMSSLQPDNTSIRLGSSQTLSRQVTNVSTNAGVMPTSTGTTNSFMSNQNQSVSTQPLFSAPQGNNSMSCQQSPVLTPLLKVKEEHVDGNLMSVCTLGQAITTDVSNQSSCKISLSSRLEESQNVLLKQLLQNTGCAQTQSTIAVPSLEAQLAQPVPSTPSALLSPLLLDTGPPVTQPQPKPSVTQPEASLVSKARKPVSRTPSREDILSPLVSPKREALPTPTTFPQVSPKRETPTLLVSPKREAPPLLMSSKKEVPLPQASPKREVPPLLVSPKRDAPPLIVSPKREIPLPQASPIKDMQLGLVEIKKEVIEETEKKTELGHIPDQTPSDIKKMKRRQYQQKRRQSQGKEAAGGPSKKRQKKVTTVEEDWDTFMENLMQNLQQLPPIHVQEPSLPSNPIVGNIFGAGDLTKLSDNNTTRFGDLHGSYGNANLFQVSDFYDSKPFGPCIPLPPPLPVSTQRGFYDQEFAPLKFVNDSEDKKIEASTRDTDSPDSVISSSSPECLFPETPVMFPGLLRLINPDSDEEDNQNSRRSSPVLPLIAPIPIRAQPLTKNVEDVDKENKGSIDDPQLKSHPSTGTPLRDSANVAVTLTLSSAAADDIVGVLRDLANFLHIPPPTSYQIVERTSTPPSQKLGLYRSKGKDGKEGAPIDIQSILNGEAKFCRHCDVVILSNSVKKKVSDLPFLAKEDIPDNEDFLNFCSTSCYMQFALMHRTPSISQDKAAATVDHLCQTEVDVKTSKVKSEAENHSSNDFGKLSEAISSATFLEQQSQVVKSSVKLLPICGTEKVKSVCFKTWSPGALQPAKKMKKTTDREMTEMLFRMGITVMPPKIPEDTRSCIFCHHVGDGIADGPARLLNYDVDRWVHLNCALWSDDVYETVNGALMNLDNALKHSLTTSCVACHKNGASIRCFKLRCSNVYHLSCAVKSECVFFKNKTMYCTAHVPKNEKDNELTTLAVFRRVYVDRDENRQVASVMHRSDHNHLMRVGSLIFLNVGQLLPHQLQSFHTFNCIYPIGYKIIRFYWSMRVHNKRCRYVCSIHDVAGRPEFRVLVQEPGQDDLELRDSSPKAVWARILEPMAVMRKEMGGIQVFPRFVSGEDLFGLTEPAIVRVLESLPGVETMSDYRFKYGRNPLLELPLAVNPTGSARSEPKLRIAYPWKRPHTQRTATSSRPVFVPTVTVAGEAACPYSKQFVHSKSSQYKKMKQDWRNNVYLARSKIQGLGLYAARDLERHTMVIEYIGEVIRTELSELREKLYEARNRGIYMFRLDEERVVDATLSGGLARYINHSCNPNCVAEIVEVDRDLRIIIFAKKRISRGEELAYDYKFDIEDDQHKIPCNCGAANCKKWMN